MDGLQWKTPLKRMIWGYPYFRKRPYDEWLAIGVLEHMPRPDRGLDIPIVYKTQTKK